MSGTADASGEPSAAAGRTSSLLRRVTVAGIALISLIVAADSYEAWRDYRTAMHDNERTQVMLGRALAEQTARMVQEADLVLADFAEWRRSPDGRAADTQAMRSRLRAEVQRLPFVYSAAVTGPDGRVLANTLDEPGGNLSLQDREVFTVPAQTAGSALYIGRAFVGRQDNVRTFALSRRIDDPDDAFAGIVVLRLSFDYLAHFYSAVHVAGGTSIRLARRDGVTLAQYPAGDLPIADDVDVKQAYLAASAPAEQVRRARPDGRARLEVMHAVEGYPIVVKVTRPMHAVLQPWVEQELGSALRTLTLALLAGLLLLALRVALARHERMELERRRLERALENAQRVEALGFLAASVAHDFNNVLTAIVGYAELARRSAAVGAPELVHFDRLLAATERARRLVRRVLTFDPRRSLQDQPLPVAPAIAEVVEQIQATLPGNVTLQVHGKDGTATMRGDPTEVHQVLMNICANAVHAMPNGGTLSIRLETVGIHQERDLTIGKLQPGRWIRVTIADTGVGMSREQVRSVFEPFYTTRKPGQGTGIGLTVVRNVIMSTDGALEVESSPGSGTRMSVYWPSIEVAATRHVAEPLPGRGQTIMVVDDDPELVGIAEELLASLGYEPVGFSDPQAALDALRRAPSRFDAVLTDERMQPLRGIDLARGVHAVAPRVPVLLMTAQRDVRVDAQARPAGIVEVMDKPLRVDTLRATLGRWLPETES